jgi:hypothetical protein
MVILIVSKILENIRNEVIVSVESELKLLIRCV